MAGSEIEPTNSTSGEEEEHSTGVSDSESEPHKTQLVPNSSSDDSESDPDQPDPSIKPISSKPMESLPRSTGKRPPAENDGGDVKRVKKTTVVAVAAPDAPEAEVGGEKKLLLFQRLWSEENEIELIQGMISYVEQKAKDPFADVNEFYDFVNDSLHIDVNNRQVLTKARRLKKKFENNVAKVEKNGKVRSFSNPHEKKMYELSKSLWGSDSGNNVVMNSSSKKVNVTPKPSNKSSKSSKSRKTVSLGNGNGGSDMVKGKDVIVTDDMIMSEGLEKMSGAKKVEMEEKWKALKVEELEFFVKKVELLKEQAEVVLNAVTKTGGAK